MKYLNFQVWTNEITNPIKRYIMTQLGPAFLSPPAERQGIVA
jgi:hypothetical protein